MRWVLELILAVWAGAGWAQGVIVTQDGNRTIIHTQGGMEPTQSPPCTDLTHAADDLTPPDLFLGIIDCLVKGRGESAAGLHILMMTKADFDAKRVADQTAHDAGQLLDKWLRETLVAEKRDLLDAGVKRLLDLTGEDFFFKVCMDLSSDGAPVHDPWYMIAHGTGPLTVNKPTFLVPDFDAEAA
jgi:hypothetical protein